MKVNSLIFYKQTFMLLTSFCVTGCARQIYTPPPTEIRVSAEAVNINTANAAELEKMPLIGAGLAQKIVEYRDRHGNFRRAEHLLLVRGMSEIKLRQIRHLIKTD